MSKYGAFVSIGFELIAIIIGAYYGGQYLDNTYKGSGLYTAILILLGLAGWMVRMLFLAKKLNSPDKDKK